MKGKNLFILAGSIGILTSSLFSGIDTTRILAETTTTFNYSDAATLEGLDVNVNTQTSSSINQKYTITSETEPVELSKLELRYYFQKADQKDINIWCDNASIQLNVSPWYVDLTSKVITSFVKDGDSYYVSIKFDSDAVLSPSTGSVSLALRIANTDWSSISDITDEKLIVTYDGVESEPESTVTPVVSVTPSITPSPVITDSPVTTVSSVVSVTPSEDVQNIYDETINPSDMPSTLAQTQAGVQYGTVTKVSYYSSTVGKMRNCNVITPANYSTSKTYPVLYLLHGIGGTEDEWLYGGCSNIISNMIASGDASEMIVVIPNVRAMYNDSVPANCLSSENIAAFDNFINDLKTDLMPFIEQNYSIKTGRENTAIAGLSMGGRESLYIGFSMLDTFGYIGAFSPAPGLLPDSSLNYVGQFKENEFTISDDSLTPEMIMLCCGTTDSVVGTVPEYYHNVLSNNGVEHFWYTMPGDHNFEVWNNGLYQFAKRIF